MDGTYYDGILMSRLIYPIIIVTLFGLWAHTQKLKVLERHICHLELQLGSQGMNLDPICEEFK